ncbi:MAG: hypothetical protein IPK00_24390 [Deltaproteobacteria bacterium]|nr:hypothetical protein [Deltaproteobacteria bacterium]
MADALERVVDAGQSLFLRRVELVFVEGIHALRAEGWVLMVVPFAILGWLFVVNGARSGLAMQLPPFAVDVGIGLFHLAIAALLLRRSRAAERSR